MNSMAASSSHDRVSLIVQGDRAVFALTYGSNYIPAADLTAAGLQYVTDVSDDWSRICMQVQRRCPHLQPLLLFVFLPSSYTTRRHQTAAAEFTLLCNFPFEYTISNIQTLCSHPFTLPQLHNPTRLAARPFVSYSLAPASCCFCAAMCVDL